VKRLIRDAKLALELDHSRRPDWWQRSAKEALDEAEKAAKEYASDYLDRTEPELREAIDAASEELTTVRDAMDDLRASASDGRADAAAYGRRLRERSLSSLKGVFADGLRVLALVPILSRHTFLSPERLDCLLLLAGVIRVPLLQPIVSLTAPLVVSRGGSGSQPVTQWVCEPNVLRNEVPAFCFRERVVVRIRHPVVRLTHGGVEVTAAAWAIARRHLAPKLRDEATFGHDNQHTADSESLQAVRNSIGHARIIPRFANRYELCQRNDRGCLGPWVPPFSSGESALRLALFGGRRFAWPYRLTRQT
jgi:hypothetical protein